MVDQIRIAVLRATIEHLILIADIHVEVLIKGLIDP